MQDMSSHGRVSPKTKSINVEANLLSERVAERLRIAEASRNRLLLIIAVLGFLGLVAPPLYQFQAVEAAKVKNAQVEHDKVHETLAALQKQVDEASPKVQEGELLILLRNQANEFIGQTILLMNCTTEGVAISTLEADVMSASMTLKCSADAQGFEDAQAFAANAKSGPFAKDVFLSSARLSTALGGKGVGFDLIKRVVFE